MAAPRCGKESVSLRLRNIRVVAIHHRTDALYGEHLGGIRRPGDECVEPGTFPWLERREHVIGEIPPRITAPYARPNRWT